MKYFIFVFIFFIFSGCGPTESETIVNLEEKREAGAWYQPTSATTWQWQLTGSINTSYTVDVYDLDLFDTPASLIDDLHSQGKKVICYFSAGSYENWRPDAGDFDTSILGNNLAGWPGEKWLDIRSASLQSIMTSRLDLAVQKNCDGVEPDNMDAYTNNTGFSLTAEDQLAYNKFLFLEAHDRGLTIGLKNDLDQIVELEPYFDFAVNEQCHFYNECHLLAPFIGHNKPVFNAEYHPDYVNNVNSKRNLMCIDSLLSKFHTLILPQDLDDSFRITCN